MRTLKKKKKKKQIEASKVDRCFRLLRINDAKQTIFYIVQRYKWVKPFHDLFREVHVVYPQQEVKES
jgi:hypothetical protein